MGRPVLLSWVCLPKKLRIVSRRPICRYSPTIGTHSNPIIAIGRHHSQQSSFLRQAMSYSLLPRERVRVRASPSLVSG